MEINGELPIAESNENANPSREKRSLDRRGLKVKACKSDNSLRLDVASNIALALS